MFIYSIRLLNAKPAKTQTNRKQGFKKDFLQHFGFCFFWFLPHLECGSKCHVNEVEISIDL